MQSNLNISTITHTESNFEPIVYSGDVSDFNDESKILFPTNKEQSNNIQNIVSKERFESLLDKYTSNLFLCMDWSNMVLAGGSVLAMLTQHTDEEKEFSDFDIFLYGLNQRECNRKLIQIYNTFKNVLGDNLLCVRTARTITFMYGIQKRYIQVIINKYDTIYDIIDCFDIDCCAVAYDGSKLYYNNLFERAFITNTNVVDLTKQTLSYEYRLAKYGRKNYQVYIFDLEKERINNQIYGKNAKYHTALAKLIVLEKLDTDYKFNNYCDIIDFYQASMRRNISLKNDYKVSEYTSTFMPNYHEKLTLLEKQTKILNINKELKCDVFFIGDINEILLGPKNPTINKIPMSTTDIGVEGIIEWCNDKQLFGRKENTPESNKEWYESAYNESSKLENVLIAIREHDNAQLLKLIGTIDVNTKDMYNHIPVHEAIIYNNIFALKTLIEYKCDLLITSKLKKTPLHTACEVGNLEATIIIIKNSTNAHKQKDSYLLTPLLYTMMYGYIDIFKILYELEKNASKKFIQWEFKHDERKNYNGLEVCLMYDSIDIAIFLLAKGYDINDHNTEQKIHILNNSININNRKFFNLLINHEYSYNLKYNKKYLLDDIKKFIARMHVPIDKKMSIEFAYTLCKFTENKSIYFEFMKALIDNIETSQVITFITDNRLTNNNKLILAYIDDKIQSLTVEDKQITYQNFKYTYSTPCFSSTELYIIPEWIIKNEYSAMINKTNKMSNNIIGKIDNDKILNHYIEIRKVILPAKNLTNLINFKKYVKVEKKDIPIDIPVSKKCKKVLAIEDDSDSDDSEPEPEEEQEESDEKIIVHKPKIIKAVKKTTDITFTSSLNINKKSNDSIKYLTISLDDKNAESMSIDYFKLMNNIKEHKEIDCLEKFNLMIKLDISQNNLLDICQKYDNYDAYSKILHALYEHQKTITKNNKIETLNKYNFISLVKIIFKSSNTCCKTLFEVLLEFDNKDIFEYILNNKTIILDNYIHNTKNTTVIFSYHEFLTKISGKDINFNEETITTTPYTIFKSIYDNYSAEILDLILTFNFTDKEYILSTMIDYISKNENENTNEFLSKILKYDNYKIDHPLCEMASTKSNTFEYLLNNMNITTTFTQNMNPLHIAIENKNLDNIKLILDKYPELLNKQSTIKSYTPLMFVITSYDMNILKYILSLSPDENIVDAFGNTALHHATINLNACASMKLISHNKENYFRMTPKDYIINMMKSYFYHVRNEKISLKKYKLGFVIRIYKTFVINNNEKRIYASKQDINKTNEFVLNSLNNNENICIGMNII